MAKVLSDGQLGKILDQYLTGSLSVHEAIEQAYGGTSPVRKLEGRTRRPKVRWAKRKGNK